VDFVSFETHCSSDAFSGSCIYTVLLIGVNVTCGSETQSRPSWHIPAKVPVLRPDFFGKEIILAMKRP
jgi:hypothetical protein